MSIICSQCGKTIDGEGIAFCPYCGAKLPPAGNPEEMGNEQEELWIRKAQAVTAYPERKKILLKGLQECPESRAIQWELLFIGDEQTPKRRNAIDFSIIKCFVLEMYRIPGNFSEDERNRMRTEFFDSPKLAACLALFSDPEAKQQEYLNRLCREYVNIFLEGNSQLMGRWFGFQTERNRDKKLAAPVAEVIRRIRKDEKLSPQQREQLQKALCLAYMERADGKTDYLDALLGEA